MSATSILDPDAGPGGRRPAPDPGTGAGPSPIDDDGPPDAGPPVERRRVDWGEDTEREDAGGVDRPDDDGEGGGDDDDPDAVDDDGADDA
ncbi:MAG: hypothetical protein RJA99_4334 [Pseudomonadota bacterium]|jgi:hypothetical protein